LHDAANRASDCPCNTRRHLLDQLRSLLRAPLRAYTLELLRAVGILRRELARGLERAHPPIQVLKSAGLHVAGDTDVACGHRCRLSTIDKRAATWETGGRRRLWWWWCATRPPVGRWNRMDRHFTSTLTCTAPQTPSDLARARRRLRQHHFFTARLAGYSRQTVQLGLLKPKHAIMCSAR